jgi:hypothetical protein
VTKTNAVLLLLGLATLMLGGCDSIGNAPPGMSENEAKSAIERMTPEERIRFIASSPSTQAQKEAKYKEIEEKTGVKAADVLKGSPQIPGAQSR